MTPPEVRWLAHAHGDAHSTKIAEYFAGCPRADAKATAEIASDRFCSYVICFVNRSGSNLLAAALRSTGAMGAPAEFFNHEDLIERARRAGLTSLAQYVRQVIRISATPNGVFGTKVGAGQLLYLTREGIIPSILRDPVFVYVTRRDILAQAVSLAIARQTGRWASTLPGNGTEPTYDPEMVIANLRWISESQALFEYYFTLHRLRPLRFCYEDLEASVDEPVARIAAALGLPAVRVAPDRIEMRRQRTALNEAFKARFLAEVAADPPPGSPP